MDASLVKSLSSKSNPLRDSLAEVPLNEGYFNELKLKLSLVRPPVTRDRPGVLQVIVEILHWVQNQWDSINCLVVDVVLVLETEDIKI